MARTTYQAPGVYVEEVPSAQQPIAGVGTNTVGFIGLVPDEIQCPEPNPAYDPVLAQLALGVAGSMAKGAGASEGDIASLDRKLKELQDKNTKLNNEVKALQKDLDKKKEDLGKLQGEVEGLEQRPEGELSDEEKRELAKKRKDQQRLMTEIQGLSEQIEGKQQEIETNDQTSQDIQAAKEGKKVSFKPGHGSVIRPYILKTFVIDADSCDTKLCTNFSEYTQLFGSFSADDSDKKPGQALHPGHRALTHAVYGFFKNGGTRCFVARIKPAAPDSIDPANPNDIDRTLTAFESIDELAIIAAPGLEAKQDIWNKLVAHCETCEDRFAILDSPAEVADENGDLAIRSLSYDEIDNVLPQRNKNAAYYFPHIEVVDPAKQMQDQDPARGVASKYRGRVHVPPSGHIAGIYARTDEERGVHKAPANCPVLGALNVKYYIGKPKQELLNPQGVNCIRNMNGNITVWGARTIGGDKNGEWKYVNVRRLFLFLRESIDEGTQWVVFEPNDPALWGKIRRNVGAFLTNVWRSGALFGLTPEEAFYVKCDAETNPPEVRELGQVITEIGVAIVRPAEFVIFRITQSGSLRAG